MVFMFQGLLSTRELDLLMLYVYLILGSREGDLFLETSDGACRTLRDISGISCINEVEYYF